MKAIADCRLYGILDLGYVPKSGLTQVLGHMLRGGVDVVQLRAKNHPEAEIEAMGREVLPMTREAGIPLIVNDFPHIAGKLGAEGVHVGQDDLPAGEVRAIVGPNAIVGKSTHSLAQARAAQSDPEIDYIGFGPIFATPTKPDYAPIGMDDIARVHSEVNLPVFCIGGIKRENAEQLLQAGASRLVIVSGILQAADIAGYVRDVCETLTNHAQPCQSS